MSTIKDVAERAGLSVATVSRALNGIPTVAPDLIERVRAAADELDYHPNAIARSLRRQSTEVIALIISDISNPFFTAIARGVEDIAQSHGYSVLLCNSDENSDKEARYLRVAEVEQVAGVILSPHNAATDVSSLRSANVPLVVVDRPLTGPVDSVMVRSVEGAREATQHLIASGWRRPACVTGPADAATALDRLEGYRQALADAGLSDEIFTHKAFTVAGGQEATGALLDAPVVPDALFIANAQMALGALAELRARGVVVGRDIGIVTFDDEPWAPYLDPPISVVAQPAYEIGSGAAQQLFARIAGDQTGFPRSTILSTRLVVRESSQRHGSEAALPGG